MRVVTTATVTAIAPAIIILLIVTAETLIQGMLILICNSRRPSTLPYRGLGRQGQVPGYRLGEHGVSLIHDRQHEVSQAEQTLTFQRGAVVYAR
jgi:hypothetical protein